MTDDPGNPRVQHGDPRNPPLTWLWDLYPLADGAWGNIEYPMDWFADWGGEPGSVIAVRRWVTGPNGPAFLTEYTPADDYVTERYNGRHATYNGLYQDEDRRCYVPQPEDLARVKSIFPKLPDPANPSWPQVEAELIAADQSPDELQRMTAPALIRLLAKSHDLTDPTSGGGAPTPAVIADRIESLIAEADDGLKVRGFVRVRGQPEPESQQRERERVEQVRQSIAANGKAIVSALVKCGESAAPLLSLLNWINDGDTVAARKDWPTAKVALQETAIRLRLRPPEGPEGPQGEDASTPPETAVEPPLKRADADDASEDDEQQADPKAPYMPADWFRDKFGIPAPRLRAARRDGRLGAINVGTKRPRYQYSVPDAMRLWPDDGIYLPDASG